MIRYFCPDCGEELTPLPESHHNFIEHACPVAYRAYVVPRYARTWTMTAASEPPVVYTK